MAVGLEEIHLGGGGPCDGTADPPCPCLAAGFECVSGVLDRLQTTITWINPSATRVGEGVCIRTEERHFANRWRHKFVSRVQVAPGAS